MSDIAAITDTKIVKAKKEHKCGACLATIAVGESYERIATLYDGSWMNHKSCLPCRTASISLDDDDGRPLPECLIEWIQGAAEFDDDGLPVLADVSAEAREAYGRWLANKKGAE